MRGAMTTFAMGLLACTGVRAADPPFCGSVTPAAAPSWPAEPLAGGLPATGPLRIVCLGSSSTQGVGASTPTASYPAQLGAMLRQRLAGRAVEVVNKGVGGETVADNLARLDRDVLALRPQLVIWQVGTNDALRGLAPERVRVPLLEGLRRLKAAGAAVVLMDPQPLPTPTQERAGAAMSAMIAAVARETGTPLFPRHRVMQQWLDRGSLRPAAVYARDGLHMTDASYRCLAQDLAGVLVAAALRR